MRFFRKLRLLGAAFLGLLFLIGGYDSGPRAADALLPREAEDKTENSVVAVGNEDLDGVYFIGDSTTWHFRKAGIADDRLWVPDSRTLLLSSDVTQIEVTAGGKRLTLPAAAREVRPRVLVVTLGVNGADHFREKTYKAYLEKLVVALHDASPETTIVLQSVFPVCAWFSDEENGISNEGIERLNGWQKELVTTLQARSFPAFYLNTQEILKNENGSQKEGYGVGDGVHLNAEAYEAILAYLRTHLPAEP